MNNPIGYCDPTGMYTESAILPDDHFSIYKTTLVVNSETGEEYNINDGYDFTFNVTSSEFEEIKDKESIKGTSAYNRWFWNAVGHELKTGKKTLQ